MKNPRRTLTALVLIVLPATLAAQGLGDASKKEQARRKQVQQQHGTEAKTYTDADVKGRAPANETGAASPAARDQGAPGGEKTATDPAAGADERLRQQDEQRWRSRLAAANARLAAARQAHETLASLTLVPGYVYQDENGRTVIGSVEQLQRMTGRAKADLDSAQKALDDLLEEARRANVPPGWLR